MANKRTESSATRKELNRNVRMAVERFDLSGLDDVAWDFLCECGDDDCQDWVSLSLAEYEALRRADGPILARGHSVSPGRHARGKARQLVADAKALQAQAEHQLKRAKRNLEKPHPS